MFRSLKARIALVLLGVYATVFVAGFLVLTWQSLATGGESHHAGPTMAMAFALDEARFGDGVLHFPPEGAFASLAAHNPSLWVLAERHGQQYSFGSVPPGARRAFAGFAGSLALGRFHVPGVARPLADAAVARRGPALLAVGGVSPEAVPLGHALRYVVGEGIALAAVAVGLVGLVALLAALPLLTAAIRPLTADVAAIRPESPQRRLREQRVPSELLPLVQGFNAALERLEGELARRRRFIRDVAHELRTPLAIVSLQVESLPDGERKLEFQRVVGRMTQLVAQMLDVERLAHGAGQDEPLDLVAMARDMVAEMAPMAIAAGYELSLRTPPGRVMVRGDLHALGRALSNLVANAVAHGGGSGEIEVVVLQEGAIEVSDQGPGVPESIRDQLFQPFCRERWDRDGCGMGLHLTREILRAHGGDALLVPTAHGARFRLAFP